MSFFKPKIRARNCLCGETFAFKVGDMMHFINQGGQEDALRSFIRSQGIGCNGIKLMFNGTQCHGSHITRRAVPEDHIKQLDEAFQKKGTRIPAPNAQEAIVNEPNDITSQESEAPNAQEAIVSEHNDTTPQESEAPNAQEVIVSERNDITPQESEAPNAQEAIVSERNDITPQESEAPNAQEVIVSECNDITPQESEAPDAKKVNVNVPIDITPQEKGEDVQGNRTIREEQDIREKMAFDKELEASLMITKRGKKRSATQKLKDTWNDGKCVTGKRTRKQPTLR